MIWSLNDLDVDRWYLVVIVLGMIGLLASIAAHERIYTGLCLGIVVIGFGELINHPMRQTIYPGMIKTSRTRKWTVLGTAVDMIGVGLVLRFSYLLAI